MAKKQTTKQTQKPFWVVGQSYFIRTVTHHLTGRLVSIDEHEILLVDAAWIGDDGRFAQAVAEGTFMEVEPYPDGRIVAVGRASLIDAVEVTFPLPRTQS